MMRLLAFFYLWVFNCVALAGPVLTITGSDTLAPLVTQWLQAFKDRYPGLRVEMQSTGSATVPTALAEGTVDIGAMSREMTREEHDEFVARRGFAPRALAIARDALVVVVNKDNPVESLTLDELDRVFSANARCSGDSPIGNWRDLGVATPALSSRPIEAFARTATSGSYGFFKSRVLCNGDYATQVVEFEGFASLVESIAGTPNAIGYTGLHWVDERVKALRLTVNLAGEAHLGSDHPDYPLTRDMFFYWAQAPGTRLSPIQCAFIQYSQSADAQSLVATQGLTSITHVERHIEQNDDLCG